MWCLSPVCSHTWWVNRRQIVVHAKQIKFQLYKASRRYNCKRLKQWFGFVMSTIFPICCSWVSLKSLRICRATMILFVALGTHYQRQWNASYKSGKVLRFFCFLVIFTSGHLLLCSPKNEEIDSTWTLTESFCLLLAKVLNSTMTHFGYHVLIYLRNQNGQPATNENCSQTKETICIHTAGSAQHNAANTTNQSGTRHWHLYSLTPAHNSSKLFRAYWYWSFQRLNFSCGFCMNGWFFQSPRLLI